MLYSVIMAGGTGTRFWPASRSALPKQLLTLVGDRTMIQATVDRLHGLVEPNRVLVVTNETLVAPIAEQLPELPAQAVLGEPCKRDTAPCIALAAAIIARRDPAAVLVVMPSDHVIGPVELFQAAVRHSVRLVEEQPARIITFGIRPSYPAESFGYIERGEPLQATGAAEEDAAAPRTFAVRMFREKPNAAQAAEYLAAGRFDWNAGIFVWRASTIIEALHRFEPEIMARAETIAAAYATPQFAVVFRDEFAAMPAKSIDYAVMEKYRPVLVVEAPFTWDDVGSWQALARQHPPDESHNVSLGRHVAINSNNCIVRTTDQHLVVTLGIDDCIVVHTENATLVGRRQDEEQIRRVVEELRRRGWDEYL